MPIDFTNVSILKVNNFSYFSQTERKEVFHLFYKRILLDLHYNEWCCWHLQGMCALHPQCEQGRF